MIKLAQKLFISQQKKLLPLFAVALIFMAASRGAMAFYEASAFELWHMAGMFCFMLGILSGVLGYGAVFLLSSLQFRSVFLTGQATLYRTLPLRRLQLFGACLLSAFGCLLETMAVLVGLLCLYDLSSVPGLLDILAERPQWLLLMGLCVLLQQVAFLLCCYMGLLIGYTRSASRLGWSLFSIVALYLFNQMTAAAALLPWMLSQSSEAALSTGPIALVQTLFTLTTGVYAVLSALYLGIEIHWLKKGVDVASQ